MTTAIAPASSACFTFSKKGILSRLISAIFPAISSCLSFALTTGYAFSSVHEAAPIMLTSGIDLSAAGSYKKGICCGLVDAPMESVFDAVAGEPTVQLSGTALPLAVTPVNPKSAVRLTAMLVGRSEERRVGQECN